MAGPTNDATILNHITQLVDEERRLWNEPNRDSHADARLEAVRVELDQCWDLLRQRDALREFGRDPNRAHVRPASVVEKYEG
jgi:hypothetical protein